MKKILAVLIAFLMISMPTVSAILDRAQGNTDSNSPPGSQVNIDILKQVLDAGIDKSIAKLKLVEARVENNKKLTAESKQSITIELQSIETELATYKDKVNAATSVDDLKALKQQIIDYLKQSKGTIKEKMKEATAEIGKVVSQKAQEFIQKAEQLIKVLKVTCPKESATLAQLDTQLQGLKTATTALQQAILAKDAAAIKTQVMEINSLAKAMKRGVKEVQAACIVSS